MDLAVFWGGFVSSRGGNGARGGDGPELPDLAAVMPGRAGSLRGPRASLRVAWSLRPVLLAVIWAANETAHPHSVGPLETMTAFKKRKRARDRCVASAAGAGSALRARSAGQDMNESRFDVARAGPTARREDRGRSRLDGGRVRLGLELPRELVVWHSRGQASAAMVRAAERFIGDYHAGFTSVLGCAGYAERVDCSGGSAGFGAATGYDARRRVDAAMAAMGRPTGDFVKAWLVDGVSAAGAVDVAGNWKKESSAKAAAGGALLCGLTCLMNFYG